LTFVDPGASWGVAETPAPPQPRLSPFDDDMLAPDQKERAVELLLSLGLPYWIASSHLGRWARYVGVELTREDFWSVGRKVRPE
jgi:hypothetical protein